LNPENKTLGGDALGSEKPTENEITGLDMAKKLIYVIPLYFKLYRSSAR
jgi:hypothetical protein